MNSKKSLLDQLKLSHTEEAIRQRLGNGPKHHYVKDFIYGAIDGAVTTFAVVAGIAGAHLAIGIVIILGVANLVGDGFSIAVSSFLATRAERDLRLKARKEEEVHVSTFPEGEKEEIRQIFQAKGFQGEELEKIISVITSDVNLWVDTMLQEEHRMPLFSPSPFRAGLSTFIAFLVVGSIPLIPFFVKLLVPSSAFNPFSWSAVATGGGFFIIGAFKSRFVGRKWLTTGLETFLMGGSAAALAYLIGMSLGHLAK